MIHTNAPKDKRPRARMRATGEIIRKNGQREPITVIGDPDMTKAELDQQLKEEWAEKNKKS